VCRLDSCSSVQYPVVSYSELDNETWGSIKGAEFLYRLRAVSFLRRSRLHRDVTDTSGSDGDD
jgi:hypothetical protein